MIKFVVDGLEFPDPDANYAGDGQFPPFMVFDVERQEYVPPAYKTREAAQAEADKLNTERREWEP